MDMGDGTFKRLSRDEEKKRRQEIEDAAGVKMRVAASVFQVGEEVTIKGSRFRIKSIGKREMHLTLLPRLT